ncbi:glycosyltransferase involved in cell wall biosynthesis [Natronocella acetinitrilica]|uniref:Glycosyltransferase involved in cell wall biosynthesis n=1 Tax=Natronocella acetinitrilica TaxID=414046 RepID=A0AAE3G4Q9_9GAMM|nr:glycosyltransferase family 4 protein [Natronocella acetinitrilica]MCP1675780.1 glycosyltransferase involved in cell wall biosynthesis [Natronocella acetinitrilica]
MRVLTVCYEYPPIGGGGGVVAAALAAQLVRTGVDVDVVTSRFDHQPWRETLDGVAIHRHACKRRHRHYTSAAELMTTLLPAYNVASRIIKATAPSLIHTHFALPGGLVAWALSKRFELPYVVTVHGSDVPGYNPDRFHLPHRFINRAWRRVMRDAAVVTSPSHYLAGLIATQIDRPVQVIPNGHVVHTTGQRPAKENLVLVVARLFPRKGVQHFLEAIRDHDEGWEYVIAGDGPHMAALREMARTVRPRVRFTGFIPRDELQGLYQRARVFVFPSIKENFPMVLLEAMEAGCAVLTTDADGCAEVVGDAGIVFPAGDTAELSRSLRWLIDHPVACAELGTRSQARAALFTWPRIATAYSEAFGDAMNATAALYDQVK